MAGLDGPPPPMRVASEHGRGKLRENDQGGGTHCAPCLPREAGGVARREPRQRQQTLLWKFPSARHLSFRNCRSHHNYSKEPRVLRAPATSMFGHRYFRPGCSPAQEDSTSRANLQGFPAAGFPAAEIPSRTSGHFSIPLKYFCETTYAIRTAIIGGTPSESGPNQVPESPQQGLLHARFHASPRSAHPRESVHTPSLPRAFRSCTLARMA